jgi:ribbon-helix-helix CopG family protein
MVKLTFSVDEETAQTLRRTAERLHKPQSMIVREAVAEYAARAGRLTEFERRRMLNAVDQIIKQPATRPQREVDRELRGIRRSRRQGGRHHPAR